MTTDTAPDSLAVARTLVEPQLREAIGRLDDHTRHVAGYHLGYWDTEGNQARDGGGKGIRSALAVLSARAVGVPSRGPAAGTAVELVHNFSLLHDDLMDRDTERHHRETAWSAFGEPSAILAGDALLTLAVEVLTEDAAAAGPTARDPGERTRPDPLLRGVRRLTAATRRLIAGQAADVGFETRIDVTLKECLAMAGDKTAALLSCASALGAILADGSSELISALTEYGERLGLAFQLVDDLLGLWGDPVATGKPVLSDLVAGKKTVPIVAAMRSDTPAGDRLRTLYGSTDPLSPEELRLAARLIEDSGARAWTDAEASRQVEAAVAALEGRDMPEDVRTELTDLAHFVTGRSY